MARALGFEYVEDLEEEDLERVGIGETGG